MKKSYMNRISHRVTPVFAILIGITVTLWAGTAISANYSGAQQASYANGRFGFGLTRSASTALEKGWPAYLNAGWYWDWAARGATQLPPLQYVQTVRLKPVLSSGVQIGYTATPTGTALLNAIAAQPGATWFIGNEPDCSTMDNMRSEWYARAYHDLYYLIKGADPTTKIAAGNIVQPTRQRFEYLNRILAAYQANYGEPLPADAWSIHSYILCEKCYPIAAPGEPFAWGACWVPDWPNSSASSALATFYSVYDHWNIDIYISRIETFRQWMYDNGYRNHPLIIPEYGVLFYEGLVYSGSTYDAKSREFMYAGFDWMLTARDSLTGYRPDDNRLVQGWAWFSLDHGDYPGGSLFDPYTYQPTTMGRDFAAYTALLTPTTELLTLDAHITVPDGEPGTLSIEPGTSVTATVNYTVSNSGDIGTEGLVVTKVIGNSPSNPTHYTVISGTAIDYLGCCGDHKVVTLPWPDYVVGEDYDFYITNQEIDLQVTNVWMPVLADVPTPITVTLSATVSNGGYSEVGEPLTVTFYHNNGSISIHIPFGQVVIPELGCCGDTQSVSVTWTNLTDGLYPYCVTAATTLVQTEPVCANLWINPPYRLYIPMVIKEVE
ncbi:MAG: hypothetical protein JXR84_11980 [Anaerolineae bacterium]|nr:hypothetical protein [Anaerolineae bacterium]